MSWEARRRRSTRCWTGVAGPGGEGGEGGVHGGLGVGGVGCLVEADELGGVGGIDAADFGVGLEALAADDEVILVSELGADVREGVSHLLLRGGLSEVLKRVVAEGRERGRGGH